jgi:hypothetical protein
MKRLYVVLVLAVTACGGGGDGSDPAAVDAAAGQSDAPRDAFVPTGNMVTDAEPNNERDEATQFPPGSGSFVVHGTCLDPSDMDYYDVHTTMLGSYQARLEWQVGSYQMMFDPEDGMTGGQVKSATSPLMANGEIIAPDETSAPQFGVDCGVTGNTSAITGLPYTLYITLP